MTARHTEPIYIVACLFTRAVCSRVILEHGNFGLGTFESRDGKIVVLDGQLSEAAADAAVGESFRDASPEPYSFESRSMKRLIALLVSFAILAGSMTVRAGPVSLPPVNLGNTNFEDGIADPGWFFEQIIDLYHAGEFEDASGEKVPGRNELSSVSSITHLAYFTRYKLFGGYIGAEVLLPVAGVDLDVASQPQARARGVGDMNINPFMLQWNDQKLFGKPFFGRFDFQVVVPTGQYDSSRSINMGNHVVSLDPYYAFTVLPTSKLEVSARLHYLWNSENDSPYVGLHASSIQPGQALHVNLAASYEVLKGLRLGINGYALQQLTDDKIDGNSIADSKERVFGIGPGLLFSGDKWWIYLNGYIETGVENRPQGTEVVLRYSRVF
jgi:hypothetical protein